VPNTPRPRHRFNNALKEGVKRGAFRKSGRGVYAPAE